MPSSSDYSDNIPDRDVVAPFLRKGKSGWWPPLHKFNWHAFQVLVDPNMSAFVVNPLDRAFKATGDHHKIAALDGADCCW